MQHRFLKALALAVFTCAIVAGPASAAPSWAPASTATIHPGVQTFTDGAQCTANFVFSDGAEVYIGYAAHCAGLGEATDTNGCVAGTLPVGTPVADVDARVSGTLPGWKLGALYKPSDDASLFLIEWRGGTADHLTRPFL